jgi:hypothetical protein
LLLVGGGCRHVLVKFLVHPGERGIGIMFLGELLLQSLHHLVILGKGFAVRLVLPGEDLLLRLWSLVASALSSLSSSRSVHPEIVVFSLHRHPGKQCSSL